MHCAQSREELGSFMDGELAPTGAAELRQHVASCAVCHRLLGRIKQTASLVRGLAEVAPPADLRDRIARRIAQASLVPELTCPEVREMLDDYAHGHLPAEKAEAADAHLCACEECRGELMRLEQSAEALHTLAEVSPPARIGQRVRAEIARRSRPAYAGPLFRGIAGVAGLAAAAVVVLMLRAPATTPPPTSLTRPEPSTRTGASAGIVAPLPATPHPATVAANDMSARTERGLEVAGKATAASSKRGRHIRIASNPVQVASSRLNTSGAPTGRGVRSLVGVPTSTKPLETAAAHPAAASAAPAAEPEPAATVERPQPSAAGEAVKANMLASAELPLSEVRQILRDQPPAEVQPIRATYRHDRFASAYIIKWGF